MSKNKPHQCRYCKKCFSRKDNLNRHAEYSCKKVVDGKSFTCNLCNKSYARYDYYQTHREKCEKKHSNSISPPSDTRDDDIAELEHEVSRLKNENEKLHVEIIEYREKISELKGEIRGIRTAPTKINNTTYNTIQSRLDRLPTTFVPPLECDYVITEVIDFYTYDLAVMGKRGVVKTVVHLIEHTNEQGEIERNYICTDTSRNTFYRLVKDKRWRKNAGGKYVGKILNYMRDPIEQHRDRACNEMDEHCFGTDEYEVVDRNLTRINSVYRGIVDDDTSHNRKKLTDKILKMIAARVEITNVEDDID